MLAASHQYPVVSAILEDMPQQGVPPMVRSGSAVNQDASVVGMLTAQQVSMGMPALCT
jgi:hypothetical protein